MFSGATLVPNVVILMGGVAILLLIAFLVALSSTATRFRSRTGITTCSQ
jgi:uncharacterized membrane protein